MSKIAVIYFSPSHQNTKKVLDAMREVREMDLLTVEEARKVDLGQYDYVGFASGIYYFNFAKPLLKMAEEMDFGSYKGVFLVYTAGNATRDFSKRFRELLEARGARFLGCFSCKGWDTYGPFKLVGGLNKGHPDEADLAAAREWARGLIED